MPKDRIKDPYSHVDGADALLVAGSSLTTRGDDLATVKIDNGCSAMLALLADELPTVASSPSKC